ncbi:MFS general substrate transporter [Mycena venus]|uniref:MFS general substrate transporter n=1 Tax=Mycena venus TaxID=2733690 RepID=A0A8H6XM81_9AGAR|nr:MFS general substrate transporter [Mycena venus]
MEASEKTSVEEPYNETAPELKLDHKGLPLIPQPSDDPEDPLNWSRAQKYLIVCIASLVAFFGTFSHATANPAYAQIGVALGVSAIDASYIGTICIAASGIGSFIWAPTSYVYGRRPVLIFAQAIVVAGNFGSAYAKSYGTIIVGRFFTGLGVASGNVLSFALISDIFCLHERGKMLGIQTVALFTGSHLAALPGGFIAQYVGWRWTMILPGIATSICWVLILFYLPETLYVRGLPPVEPTGKHYRMRLAGTKAAGRKLKLIDFARPFQMLKYIPILFVG